MATTYHFRASDPIYQTPEQRRRLARRTPEQPLCGLCAEYHAPAVTCRALRQAATDTRTTREQRTALTVPAPPSNRDGIASTAALGVALRDAIRQSRQPSHTSPPAVNEHGIASPPSLFDAVRAARGGRS